jgi:hypothetical protein
MIPYRVKTHLLPFTRLMHSSRKGSLLTALFTLRKQLSQLERQHLFVLTTLFFSLKFYMTDLMWGLRCLVGRGPVVSSTALVRPQLGPVCGQVGVYAVRMLLQSKNRFLSPTSATKK